MGLMDASAEEKAVAEKIFGTTDENADAPDTKAKGDAEKADEKPEKPEKPDKAEAKTEQSEEAAGADKTSAEEEDPGAKVQKRINKLTRQARSAERAAKAAEARESASRNEMATIKAQLAELQAKFEAPLEKPGEDATREEIDEYYQKKAALEQQKAEERARVMFIQSQISTQRAIHNGRDGNPSFDQLMANWETRIDQEPAFAVIKAKIQAAENAPEMFVQEASKLEKAAKEQEEEAEGEEEAEKESAELMSGGNKSSVTRKSKAGLSREERALGQEIFGHRTDIEKIDQQRKGVKRSVNKLMGIK